MLSAASHHISPTVAAQLTARSPGMQSASGNGQLWPLQVVNHSRKPCETPVVPLT